MYPTEFLAWVGFIAGFCVILPQIVKTLRTKNSSCLTIWMPIVYLIHCSCMLPRVIELGEWPYIVSYIYAFLANIYFIVLIIKYRRNNGK